MKNEINNQDFIELRQQSGMSRPKFAEYFGIPYRTIQNWELNTNTCPSYTVDLMRYKLENERGKQKAPDVTLIINGQEYNPEK